MNGIKAHLQAGSPYNAGTDDVALTPGAYRLLLWKNTSFLKGWTLDPASGALYPKTPGLKLIRGVVWVTAGLTPGDVNTLKITQNGNPANLVTQDGTDVDAAVNYAAGTGAQAGRSGFAFGGVANMVVGDFIRVWFFPTGGGGAGSITVNGHLAHTMISCIDNGGGYSY